MMAERLDNWRDLALGSLLTSPFLFFSLGFHMILFYVLGYLAWSLPPEKPNVPIPVSLIEFGSGSSLSTKASVRRAAREGHASAKASERLATQSQSGKGRFLVRTVRSNHRINSGRPV